MRKALLLTLAIFGITAINACKKEDDKSSKVTSTFTDPRDGQIYKTVQIGSQTWFAQNLNYATVNSWFYNNDSSNGAIYGRLYDWQTAMTACPVGWHLPSDIEWITLIDYLGGESVAGGKMKTTSGWDVPNAGATNTSGFSGLPGGFRNSNGTYYYNIGATGLWWSSSVIDANNVWYRSLYNEYEYVNRGYYGKKNGMSCRCVKN